MSKTLGGCLFIRNGDILDYCYVQSIQCLLEFCDKVVVCVVPTGQDGDNTSFNIFNTFELAIRSGQLYVRVMQDTDWLKMDFQTKHRLSIYTNYAIEMLDTDYVFSLQGDEIVDPSSYQYIRQAMEEGQEGYLCTRVNLWGSPYTQLNVEHHRKPCSTEIVRLTKTCYRAYDDAESIAAPCVDSCLDKIKIWHLGFVRKRDVHVEKIRTMQSDIFKVSPDSKLEGMSNFDPWKWFEKTDVIPIIGELPPLIREWAKERHYE
jgi:hypothetical protein